MHDPDIPDHTGVAGPGTPDDAGDDDAYEGVTEKIKEIAAWYAEQIRVERGRSAPDRQRIDQLVAGYGACMEDLRRLRLATAQEIDQAAAAYDAKLRDIAGP
ncbi:hypothetical protein ACGF07_34815 [Kitasatospora sp. NPDC048194]|uniref:hypothetical protein n=1 Tax=Kitasatospora sp. NPDC048194 TaxID=3364045 RepID=UPI00371E87E7